MPGERGRTTWCPFVVPFCMVDRCQRREREGWIAKIGPVIWYLRRRKRRAGVAARRSVHHKRRRTRYRSEAPGACMQSPRCTVTANGLFDIRTSPGSTSLYAYMVCCSEPMVLPMFTYIRAHSLPWIEPVTRTLARRQQLTCNISGLPYYD